jgi:hypothetical protein
MYLFPAPAVAVNRKLGALQAMRRRRRLRWLGQDDGDDGSVPNITESFPSTLPSDLEPTSIAIPPTPASMAPGAIATTSYPEPTLTAPVASPASLTSSQIATLTAQSIAAGVAPALAATAAAQGRAYTVPTPTSSVSAFLGSIPSWMLYGGVGLIALAAIASMKKR